MGKEHVESPGKRLQKQCRRQTPKTEATATATDPGSWGQETDRRSDCRGPTELVAGSKAEDEY